LNYLIDWYYNNNSNEQQKFKGIQNAVHHRSEKTLLQCQVQLLSQNDLEKK